jgi:hypothetical protein
MPVADRIGSDMFVNKKVYSEDRRLNATLLSDLASNSTTEYFYVINTDTYLLFNADSLDFKPKEWDSKYVHIWNDSQIVRLYNKKEVLSNPAAFTDDAMEAGEVSLKNLNGSMFTTLVSDIVFLSYDESFADQHYADLLVRYPRAKRVHGVKGIYEAHKAASKIAKTDYFFVVDADAKIVPEFDFDYYPSAYDAQSTHVWHSRNPINDLEYGYGGVKLFSTKMLREYNGSPIDFTTTVSSSFKVVPIVSNITCFNTDPFSAWRSAFRECAKLASKLIPNQDNTESEERLRIWCSVGAERDFGDFAIMGANEGMDFGKTYQNQPEMLRLINDFEWLEGRFSS